jgi:hypothetical protein
MPVSVDTQKSKSKVVAYGKPAPSVRFSRLGGASIGRALLVGTATADAGARAEYERPWRCRGLPAQRRGHGQPHVDSSPRQA